MLAKNFKMILMLVSSQDDVCGMSVGVVVSDVCSWMLLTDEWKESAEGQKICSS